MPSSISRLTAQDHDRLARLLRRASTSGPSQDRWRAELLHLLRAHLAAESASLTPEVLEALGDIRRTTDSLAAVRSEIEASSVVVEGAALGSAELTAGCGRLADLLGRHADLLSAGVLQPLESAAARKELRRLGGVYESHRDGGLREQGESEPPPRRLDLSRAELYELAKRAGIEGRSSMSRRDLIAQLQQRLHTR